MRKIKFRGMRKDNHLWEHGHYYEEAAPLQPTGGKQAPAYIVFPSFADWNMPRQMLRAEVLPDTVGQFTGLKDKNDKEIYEGDIVQARLNIQEYANFVVEFADGCFEIRQGNYREYLKVAVANRVVKIIGNIYENPELLEE